jgi:transcriptional regulator with XRE-family HTH domain
MPARPKIGAQIRRARQLLDMRQQDLADKLGVSRNSIDSWENDRSYPQRTLARLEQVLGVSLDEDAPAAGPLDDLKPWQEPWEEQVAADEGLAVDTRRWLITDSRAARVAHAARKQSQRGPSSRDRDREAG